MNQNDKDYLLKIAQDVIGKKLASKSFEIDEKEIPESLKQKRACFVTLKIDGELRGCIGHLEAHQELYKDVIENAYNATFCDSRFAPLAKEEFAKIDIEISILSTPQKLDYKSNAELINFLEQNHLGVILGFSGKSATFLPQVWQSLPNAKTFLSELCVKAGLSSNAWKSDKVKIETYFVEIIN